MPPHNATWLKKGINKAKNFIGDRFEKVVKQFWRVLYTYADRSPRRVRKDSATTQHKLHCIEREHGKGMSIHSKVKFANNESIPKQKLKHAKRNVRNITHQDFVNWKYDGLVTFNQKSNSTSKSIKSFSPLRRGNSPKNSHMKDVISMCNFQSFIHNPHRFCSS